MKKLIIYTTILISFGIFLSNYLTPLKKPGVFSKTHSSYMLKPWASIGGCGTDCEELKTTVTGKEMNNFLNKASGGPSAKLIFVEHLGSSTNMCYTTFNENDTTFPELKAMRNVGDAKVPMLSPDGNWIVYAKGKGAEAQGNSNKASEGFFCKLDPDAMPISINEELGIDTVVEPRFVYNGDTNKFTIVFGTRPGDEAWDIGHTKAVEVDVSGAQPQFGAPWTVSSGSFSAGMSPDSTFVGGGGGTIAMLNRNTSELNDSSIIPFNQACQASMTSSRLKPNMMSYLSFTVRPEDVPEGFHGPDSWGKWDLLLVTDFNGKNVMNFYYPENDLPPKKEWEEYNGGTSYIQDHRWHHPEWSNHPYFSVSSVEISRTFDLGNENYEDQKYQEVAYLINMKDSAYLRAIEWDTTYNRSNWNGIYWPSLWVEKSQNFQEEEDWYVKYVNSMREMPSNEQNSVKITNGRLISDIPMKKITVYSTLGKVIDKYDLNGKTAYKLNTYPTHQPVILLIHTDKGTHAIKTFECSQY